MATKIYNVYDLQNIKNNLSGDYELANDIDASVTQSWNGGLGFEPVGKMDAKFTGSFDGKGYTITGLYINRPSEDEVALFGHTRGSSIQNVNLVNVNITGYRQTGALIGRIYGDPNPCIVTNCHSSGSIVGYRYVGGLIGHIYGSVIHSCSSSCNVQGRDSVGGFVGLIREEGELYGCFATGNVIGALWNAGGFFGESDERTIRQCYATGSANGDIVVGGFGGLCRSETQVYDCYARGSAAGIDSVAGFIGWIIGDDTPVERCYSTGLVTGETDVNGFSGGEGTNLNCFWDIQTSGQATSAGGTGKTTAQMKARPTFTNAGWDIATTNTSRNDGYPFLAWELGKSGTWLIYEYTPPPLSPRNQRPVQDKVTLEAIRNIEVTAGGRFFIDREGRAVYRSRYARNK